MPSLLFFFFPGGVGNRPASFMPMSGTHSSAPDSSVPGSSLPGYGAPFPGNAASLSPSGPGTAGRNVNVHLVLTPGAADQSGQGEPSNFS